MARTSEAVSNLIDSARRRRIVQLVIDQSATALAAACAALILLMVLGTQVLDWYWLAIVFGTAFGFGCWRMLRLLPSRYALAQDIDSRLGLCDALSTAVHFEDTARPGDPALREAQRAQAEVIARGVAAGAVYPITVPRGLMIAAAIALVAGGMLALRYGVTRSLDMKPSLARMVYDRFFEPDVREAKAAQSPWRKKLDEELQKLGINMNATDARQDQNEAAPDSALTPKDGTEAGSQNSEDGSKAQTASVPNEEQSGESGEGEKGEKASASSDKPGNDQNGESNDGNSQDGKQAPQNKNGKEGQGQNSSLLDKMRDAMSNLMNKMKMNSKSGDKQNGQQNAQQGGQSQQQGKGEKTQSAGKQQSQGGDQQDQQGQQQAQGDQSQAAKGKSGDKSANPDASQDAKSGIGKQDGDKSAREAEQLAAMGKISEILGKRAKDVTGEIMVEVSSGNQQLKTQYSSNKAAHAEAGGEISRDEVPIEYQQYVQQYFEQVRKQGAAPKKKP